MSHENIESNEFEQKILLSLQSEQLRAPAASSSTDFTTQRKRIKRSKDITGVIGTPSRSNQLHSLLEQENEFDLFAKTIACHLKKLPENLALESMAHIQSYLVEQRLKTQEPCFMTFDDCKLSSEGSPCSNLEYSDET